MFSKILTLAEKRGFIKKIVTPRLNVELVKIGPIGLLLQENLKQEWFYNAVINKDLTVFLSKQDVSVTYDYAKAACLENIPFGIAEIIEVKEHSSLIENYSDVARDKKLDFEKLFTSDDTILKCSVFQAPEQSIPFFHQWQRQRRTWWRKFSGVPGRYSLTDSKNGNDGIQTVDILAKYPWGSQVVETLNLIPQNKNFTSEQLQFKQGKKPIQSHSIVSEIKISTMFFNTICDAFDEALFQGSPRELLRLHRKLAPYKISFAVAGSNAGVVSELSDLALYLCKQLRSNHISTLLLPSSVKHTLEAQYKQYDELGIPYNLVLNENTLKNGIAQLRSRDTTLKEQVHVSNLATYMEQLFRNY